MILYIYDIMLPMLKYFKANNRYLNNIFCLLDKMPIDSVALHEYMKI